MNLQLLFENNEKTISLFLSEEDALIIIRLSGAVEHESYKAAFEKLYNTITVYKYKKIIYDLKDLTRTDMQSRAWYATSFLPRVIKNFGLDFKTALVKSNNKYESLSVDFLTKVGSNLGFKENIRYFDTKAEALSWIREKKEVPA
jgi:uncharacterized protein YihD (DUF1040 family)